MAARGADFIDPEAETGLGRGPKGSGGSAAPGASVPLPGAAGVVPGAAAVPPGAPAAPVRARHRSVRPVTSPQLLFVRLEIELPMSSSPGDPRPPHLAS
jgi:hypothetical protein